MHSTHSLDIFMAMKISRLSQNFTVTLPAPVRANVHRLACTPNEGPGDVHEREASRGWLVNAELLASPTARG